MKKIKKTINLAAISAMAVSGIVAANPHQADAATNAESLVVKAEQNKTILIRAISMEYKADAKTQPWAQYSKAKVDYDAAKKAVSKLSAKERTRLNARLDAVNVWIDRTAVYIDAITSGKKLAGLQAELEKNMTATNLEGMTQTYYKLSYEIKKQAAYLYKVYGKSTRDAMLKKYELPADAVKQKALYPVSIYIEIGRLVSAIEGENDALADKAFNNINTWVQKIDSVAMREALGNYYMEQLAPYLGEEKISTIEPYENFQFKTGDPDVYAYDAFGLFNEDGIEIDAYPYDQGFVVIDEKGYFDEEGWLVKTYEETGLTEAGTDKITIIDTNNNNKVVVEAVVTIVDGKVTTTSDAK